MSYCIHKASHTLIYQATATIKIGTMMTLRGSAFLVVLYIHLPCAWILEDL